MSNNQQQAVAVRPKALEVMAVRLNVEAPTLYKNLKETVFKGATDAEMMTLVVVANEYGLNPLTREMYAFPKKGGGIVPVVAIDGWVKMANRTKRVQKVEFTTTFKDVKGQGQRIPDECTCTMTVKAEEGGEPSVFAITEYYDECNRPSDPWRTMPCRMLRHKAYMQCARYAFGFSGIYDEDEARDIVTTGGTTIDVTASVAPEFMGGPVSEPKKVAAPAAAPKAEPAPESITGEPKKTYTRRRPPAPPVQQEAPAPEPEPEPTPEPAQEEESDLGPQSEGTQLTNPLRELNKLMVADSISADQVMLFGMEKDWISDMAQELEEIDVKTVLKFITLWKKILPELKAIPQG